MKTYTSIFLSFIVAVLFLGVFTGCQTTDKSEGVVVDPKTSRHGWTVFSGPKRTLVDVNDEGSIARGKALYQQHCQKCHGPKATGDGPLAKELGLKPRNLRVYQKQLPNYYIVMQINKGTGEMPRWQDTLSSRESWDLSNFIRSLK